MTLLFTTTLFIALYYATVDPLVTQCRGLGLALPGELCTTTNKCCSLNGTTMPFCHPPSGRCVTACPNNGDSCAQDSDCCPGTAQWGKTYCNQTLKICIGCSGRGDMCENEYSSCCKTPGLVCRYNPVQGWKTCF